MPPKKTPKKSDQPSPSTEGVFFPEWVTALLESQRQLAEKQEQRHEEQVERLERRHQEQIQQLAQIVSQSATAGTGAAGGGSADASDAEVAAPPTAQDGPAVRAAHPPERLARDVSLRTFKSWRQTWEDYATLARLHKLSSLEQIACLRTCFTEEMRSTLEHVIGEDSNSTKDVLDRIEKHLRNQRNVALDRVLFEERRQEEGESFDSFFISLKELAGEAELCDSCLDDRLTTRIISGIRDSECRRRLLALRPFPKLQEAVDMCRSAEISKSNEAALAGSADQTVGRLSRPKTGTQKSGFQPLPRRREKCGFCGEDPHESQDQCPAWGKYCEQCGKKNHRGSECRQRKTDPRTRPVNMSKGQQRLPQPALRQITLADVVRDRSCRKAPTVSVQILRPFDGNLRGVVDAVPDSGAEASVVSASHLTNLGLQPADLAPCHQETIRTANGQRMRCLGTFPATFQIGNRTARDEVYVFDNIQSPLMSWYVSLDLGILPMNYPEPQAPQVNISSMAETTNAAAFDSPTNGRHGQRSTPRSNSSNATTARLEHTTDVKTDTNHIINIKEQFLKEYADVFATHEELKPMDGPPVHIHLQKDAKAHSVGAARDIPIAWRDTVKTEIDDMVRRGIIEPVGDVPSNWCSPLVIVPKHDGKPRVCVDYTMLNKQVQRPLHPLRTPKDAVSSLPPGAKFFSTLDAANGYWQLPLDEDSQSLTTFITPWGRFKFLRTPMGLNSTGDSYCRRGDVALDGIGNVSKVVDDIIIADTGLDEHIERVRAVLERCRQHGITLRPEKFQFAQPKVKYCGYVISSDGKEVDPDKLAAIANFPTPSNITDLRSFMGLVQQMSDFTPEIASSAETLRSLLQPKNVFNWTQAHEDAFNAVKDTLLKVHSLAHFDPSLPTALLTDAARLKGVAYALMQQHEGKWKVVQCGSRFLSDTESRYAVVELELLAIAWALHKCRIFLMGLQHFEIVTDHKPLIPILNDYTLDAVENLRLQRMKEKTSMYSFKAVWRRGKQHAIPDALSRAPVSTPTADDTAMLQNIEFCVNIISEAPDLQLSHLREVARTDPEYKALVKTVTEGFPSRKSDIAAHLLPFWKVRNALCVDDDIVLKGAQLVIPKQARRDVLDRLHDAHQGIERTKRRARQIVWWPGISADITNTVQGCSVCQERLPSQQREPLMTDPEPSRVFEEVSADIFSHAGRSFLAYVDRLSGWPVVHVFPKGDTTAKQVIRALRQNFVMLGVPVTMRSDGGPQFSGRHFGDFMHRWGVRHVMSSPHFPQSNGLAEAAVKTLKHLVAKTTVDGNIDDEKFDRGLLELRNCPRQDGRSPAQVVLGHPLRSCVPAHHRSFAPEWQTSAERCDQKRAENREQTEGTYNRSARPLPPLKIADEVRLQDPISKRWDRIGVVVGIGRHRDYHIKVPSGRVYWRNRRLLRRLHPPGVGGLTAVSASGDRGSGEMAPSAPRRGSRARRQPDRYHP